MNFNAVGYRPQPSRGPFLPCPGSSIPFYQAASYDSYTAGSFCSPCLLPPPPYDPGSLGSPTLPPFNLLDKLSRIPTKCYYCDGSGKCQQDYPRPGSGKDWKGEDEYRCSGSGKCQHCGGSGWIYTRRTVTMPAA